MPGVALGDVAASSTDVPPHAPSPATTSPPNAVRITVRREITWREGSSEPDGVTRAGYDVMSQFRMSQFMS